MLKFYRKLVVYVANIVFFAIRCSLLGKKIST